MRCPVVALRQLTSKFGIYCGRAGARTIRLHGRALLSGGGLLQVSILGWHQPGAAGIMLRTQQQQVMKSLGGDGAMMSRLPGHSQGPIC